MSKGTIKPPKPGMDPVAGTMHKTNVWLLTTDYIRGGLGARPLAVIGVQGRSGMLLASTLARQSFAYDTGRVLDDVPDLEFRTGWRKAPETDNDWTFNPKGSRVNFTLTQIKEVSP